MPKKTQLIEPPNRFRLDGNKGGDYLEIREVKPGMVYIEVGHCCVVYIAAEMPIEMITAALAAEDTEGFGWESTDRWSDFGRELKARCINKRNGKDEPMFPVQYQEQKEKENENVK